MKPVPRASVQKSAWLLSLILALGITHSAMAQQDVQIAFINMKKVFEEYEQTRKADQQLKQMSDKFKSKRKSMMQTYQDFEKQFKAAREKANNAALSEQARSEARKKASDLLTKMREQEKKIQNFMQDRRRQLQDQATRMRDDLVKKIRKVVRNHAKQEGYKAVIDSSGRTSNQVPTALFVASNRDITQDIIARLNEQAAASKSE